MQNSSLNNLLIIYPQKQPLTNDGTKQDREAVHDRQDMKKYFIFFQTCYLQH